MFFGSDDAGEAPRAEESVSQLDKAVIPGEPNPVSSTGQACGARPVVRQAVRQAHGPEQSRRTHHPERSRRGIQESGEKIRLFWISRRLRREMTNRDTTSSRGASVQGE
jgi:hypothetical protein